MRFTKPWHNPDRSWHMWKTPAQAKLELQERRAAMKEQEPLIVTWATPERKAAFLREIGPERL